MSNPCPAAVGNSGSVTSTPRLRSPLRGALLFSCLRGALLFGDFLFCLAPHAHERIDQIVDRFMPLGLATHPHQGVEQIIDGFSFFGHGAGAANRPAAPISCLETRAACAVLRAI